MLAWYLKSSWSCRTATISVTVQRWLFLNAYCSAENSSCVVPACREENATNQTSNQQAVIIYLQHASNRQYTASLLTSTVTSYLRAKKEVVSSHPIPAASCNAVRPALSVQAVSTTCCSAFKHPLVPDIIAQYNHGGVPCYI